MLSFFYYYYVPAKSANIVLFYTLHREKREIHTQEYRPDFTLHNISSVVYTCMIASREVYSYLYTNIMLVLYSLLLNS